jgi:predicted alpha/beta superfamily hydrolase
MLNSSITKSTLQMLLVLSLGVVNPAFATSLPNLEISMGKLETLKSETLNQQRSLFVRLPPSYTQSKKAYPVLYLLDANRFFTGNVYQEAVTLVSRLEEVNDIPELIVVGIQSDQWYKDVVTEAKPFETYISHEVVDYIENKYRTLPNRILMGHSYAGAFVSGAIPDESKTFDLHLALSPVYPSMSFINKVIDRYLQLKPNSSKLTIIDGDENPMDKLILERAAAKLDKGILKFNYHSKPLDGHMSVLNIGLSHGLREHFSDFRFPSRKMVRQTSFDLKKLKAYFQNKDQKYASKTDETKLKGLAISMAHRYTSMQQFDKARPFWRYGSSKFKEYFMNGYAERFIALGETDLAIQIWRELNELFPESEKNYLARISAINKTK